MSNRVSNDHPSVHTVDATVIRAGRTDRPRLAIPPADADHFPPGEVVRLVIDGTEYFTLVAENLAGDEIELRGAFTTPDGARNPDGTDQLGDWRADSRVAFGNTAHVDVVEPGYKYGLRAPGEHAVYTGGKPDSGLQDLARDLLDDS